VVAAPRRSGKARLLSVEARLLRHGPEPGRHRDASDGVHERLQVFLEIRVETPSRKRAKRHWTIVVRPANAAELSIPIAGAVLDFLQPAIEAVLPDEGESVLALPKRIARLTVGFGYDTVSGLLGLDGGLRLALQRSQRFDPGARRLNIGALAKRDGIDRT